MNVLLCVPDYSCVSKRARMVKVVYRQPSKGRITDLVIDSTSLKVFGEGEWKVREHGVEKQRVWRTLHLAVDPATYDIMAAQAGACLCGWRLWQQSQPSAYLASGATACIPPRKEGLAHSKKISGDHRRSLAETAMYRFKLLLAGKISLRNYNG